MEKGDGKQVLWQSALLPVTDPVSDHRISAHPPPGRRSSSSRGTSLDALIEFEFVIDYHSSTFSRAYRQMLKDALKSDGNFPVYTEGSREYIILDSVMSGYIEMLLQLLDSDTVSMEEAFHFAYYTMENGTRPALRKRFGIT